MPVRRSLQSSSADTNPVPRAPRRAYAQAAEAGRDLEALQAIAENDEITQRGLSSRLGIALGLTNLYLKRLVRKGWVKYINIRSNRIRYLLTPTGIAEKTRLTYEFMDFSLHLYAQVRQHLRAVLAPLSAGGRQRIAIYGSGEAAELAYLSILELGLDLVAVFDAEPNGIFLGQPVRDVCDPDAPAFDLLIVATLERPHAIIDRLVASGVAAEKLVYLREDRRMGAAGSRRGRARA